MSLSGKVFAITGGASGIGLATAKLLSSRGATVCVADIDAEAMEKTKDYFEAHGAAYTVNRVNVAVRADVDAWMDSIIEKYGRLDGAANVAGIIGKVHGTTSVADMPDNEWDRIIAVNLTGTMYCLRAELRRIVDGGSIVNISSIHGLKGTVGLALRYTALCSHALDMLKHLLTTLFGVFTGFANHAAYDASKHGLIGMTKAAAQEIGHREIRVNSVAPGSVYTPLMQKEWDNSGRPSDAPFDEPTAFRRRGSVEETANVIVFLLGPESTFVSGSVYQVDGAWS